MSLLESKLARALLGTAPDSRSTGVRHRATQLGGAGVLVPIAFAFPAPPPPSVQDAGRGMGGPELLPPPWVNSLSPARPASDEPLASVQALVWRRPAMQRASGESGAVGLGIWESEMWETLGPVFKKLWPGWTLVKC